METTYYTLTAREIIVSGDAVAKADAVGGNAVRQLVCVRRPAQRRQEKDNVIDLAAWKASREEETRLEEAWYDGVDERMEAYIAPAPRPRRDHKATVLVGGELLATLSVIGAMAILVLRMLMF